VAFLQAPPELMDTVVGAIKQDLGRTDDGAQCLALACIANMGGPALAGALADGVRVAPARAKPNGAPVPTTHEGGGVFRAANSLRKRLTRARARTHDARPVLAPAVLHGRR
jgi:hypothetical protein